MQQMFVRGGHGMALGASIAVVLAISLVSVFVRLSVSEASIVPLPSPSAAPVPEPTDTVVLAARIDIVVKEKPVATPLKGACGTKGARLVRYRVSVGKGQPTTAGAFARAVGSVLCDERGWTKSNAVRFRYDPKATLVIKLLSATQTEKRCLTLTGLSVGRKWSCAAAGRSEVVLNADRWFEGSPTWDGTVTKYRALLVNHEVGHILGLGHRGCSGHGAAPVMMQQSKGLNRCSPNAWPLAAELRRVRARR